MEGRERDRVEQCLDATRRSDNDFYDDPKDIDHGEEETKTDRWSVCYKQDITFPSEEYYYKFG